MTLQALKKGTRDTVCRYQFVTHLIMYGTFFQVNSQLISNVCLDAISAGKVDSKINTLKT